MKAKEESGWEVTTVVTIHLDRAGTVMAPGMPEAPLVCAAPGEGRVLLLDALRAAGRVSAAR